MPKKRKVKRRRVKGKVAPAPLTRQQQFLPIHNSALKNKARDDAEVTRQVQAEEKELKLDTLKLQRELAKKKLSLL
tara:strand:+ start:288 stop:515 length:228 start_codon:yes stop_codon:yes gene_type:complete